MELRNLSMSFKAEDENLKVQGVVNKPEEISELLTTKRGTKFREKVRKGAFANALEKAREINFLFDHSIDKLLASTTNDSLSLKETDEGVVMEANIVQTSYGKDAYELIKSGLIGNMSFGFSCIKDSWERMSDGTPLRVLEEISLHEVSCLKNPAYSQSAISARGLDGDEELQIPDFTDYSIERRNAKDEVVEKLEVRTNESNETHVYVDGEIGWTVEDKVWSFDAVIPKDLTEIMDFLNTKDVVHVHVNTPGGSVWGGFGLYNAIKNIKGKTVAEITMASSSGSVVAFACDEVNMSNASMFMIHKPLVGVYGNVNELKRQITKLDSIQEVILDIYMEKAKEGITREEINELINNETYLTRTDMAKYFNLGGLENIEPQKEEEPTEENQVESNPVEETTNQEVIIDNSTDGEESNKEETPNDKCSEEVTNLMKEYLEMKRRMIHE